MDGSFSRFLNHRCLASFSLMAVFGLAGCGESGTTPMGPDAVDLVASFDLVQVVPQGDMCAVIDLDNQDPALSHGSIVASLSLPGFSFSTNVSVVPGGSRSTNVLRAYDTNPPVGPDPDLEATADCNPCLGQNNVLVIEDSEGWAAEGDSPDGGTITFSGFSGHGTFFIEQFKAIDDDADEAAFVAHADGNYIGESTPLGDGTVQTVLTDQITFTDHFDIVFDGSGAVDDIVVCACTGELGDFVWNDANGDGIQDGSEVGLAGVRVVLNDGQGSYLGETTTDSNGYYFFTDLCAGDYQVMVDETSVPDGWTQTPTGQGSDPTIDNNPNPFAVNLPDHDGSDLTIDFGYMEPLKLLDGRFTGGGSFFLGKTRFTHGFELRCDATDHRQNLQINWEGNRFHLTSLTSAMCTDDPNIVPRPPKAGLDTYDGVGVGRLNGIDGAAIVFKITDAGEPGRLDTMTISITPPAGHPLGPDPIEVSNFLKKGNHQAHEIKP